MTSIRNSTAAIALLAAFALVACDATTGASLGQSSTARASGGQVAERDVEAPDVFSIQDRALWDGRPSLGGVWVAHPDVSAPERVVIRNTQTGDEVIGALFRRERMNPGPVFQVSGEAAEALGMLAGAPTEISVVALRTEEVRIGGDPEPADTPDAMDPDAMDPGATEPAQETRIAGDDADDAAADPAETQIEMTAAEPERRERRGLFGLFGRRSATPEPQVAAGIETTPLEGDAPPASAPAETAAAAPAPAPEAPPSSLSQPFIQLGIFSVEANAERARAMAAGAGLSATVRPGETRGQQFWRVVVGPATTSAERARLLEQVKALGFADAYAVTR